MDNRKSRILNLRPGVGGGYARFAMPSYFRLKVVIGLLDAWSMQ